MLDSIGFIGLGTMGEPMCRNLITKSNQPVIAFDVRSEPLERLRSDGVKIADSIGDLCSNSHTIFLSLPSGEHVKEICFKKNGLLHHLSPGQYLIDCSTSQPELAQQLYKNLVKSGVYFADAPVARTRQAAIDGTLSIMVGSDKKVFLEILPFLRNMATDVTHCGMAGAGQTVKILNNLILFQNCIALAETLNLARESGLDEKLFLETVAKSSGDSFALRNHGMKAMLKHKYPKNAFSVEYALKDVKYALEIAKKKDIKIRGAKQVCETFEQAILNGFGDNYHPVIRELING